MLHWQNRQKRFALARRSLPPIRVELHPFALAALVLAGLALVGWSAATTSYALFRDEFLQQIVVRHSSTERASGLELSRLQAELDQVNSRLLIEREGFAAKLEELSRRQAEVERRSRAILGGTTQTGPGTDFDESALRLGSPSDSQPAAPAGRPTAERLSAKYDVIEREQLIAMTSMKSQIDADRQRLNRVYARLGLTPVTATPVKAGLGGLYLPLGFGQPSGDGDVESLESAKAEVSRLRAGLDRIPLRSPSPGSPLSSGFGNRPDPFLGTLAFHSGLDLEAPPGSPARASADGTVASAGWEGGYGLMVEVRHANGYSTRYAHLSSVAVERGHEVKAGDVVGRVGSTGRSTGPHLHYETRLNDAPLDPRRFLTAGAELD